MRGWGIVGLVNEPSAVDRALERARRRIAPRARPEDISPAIGSGALVVDIRPDTLRGRDGEIPGSIVVERNVLEWRLDPTCETRLADMDDPARRVIVVCDEGYASSLAAAALADLGLSDVTDLEGGYQAWRHSTSPADRQT